MSKESIQDQLDAAEMARRAESQERLAEQEAFNYFRSHEGVSAGDNEGAPGAEGAGE